jgi:FkbM family methyltransferase
VGANEGQSAEYYVRVFPSAETYLIEPFGSAYKRLVQRVSKFSHVRTFQLALADSIRTAKIQLSPLSVQNTLRNELGDSFSSGCESVTNKMLDSFCAERNVSHVDLEVLKGSEAMLRSHWIQFILTEATFRPKDSYHTSFFRLVDYLPGFGYCFVDLHDHDLVSRSLPRPPLAYCNALSTVCKG